MCSENKDGIELLPHHEQQPLCTTRLPYRQGRKLTAVKVYTINNESNHLLIFGVPSLNLRHETKSLLSKFGKLLKFVLTTDYTAERFTETYHAVFDKIQAARIAKNMLDTKNYYGGCLHISYAPELESIEETQLKIMQRRKDVVYRLNNLKKDSGIKDNNIDTEPQKETLKINRCSSTANKVTSNVSNSKLNMGELNTIICYSNNKKRKVNAEKKIKPCFEKTPIIKKVIHPDEETMDSRLKGFVNNKDKIDIIDCTAVDKDTITNINDSLNYTEFGNEVIKNVPSKPLNVIKFSLNKKL